jgi:hypothetical protein
MGYGNGTMQGNGWGDSSIFPGKAYLYIDIEPCNFVSIPIITASVRSEVWALCPPLTQREVHPNKFSVYTYEDATAAKMESNKCNVHWSAFGYVC